MAGLYRHVPRMYVHLIIPLTDSICLSSPSTSALCEWFSDPLHDADRCANCVAVSAHVSARTWPPAAISESWQEHTLIQGLLQHQNGPIHNTHDGLLISLYRKQHIRLTPFPYFYDPDSDVVGPRAYVKDMSLFKIWHAFTTHDSEERSTSRN